MAQPEDTSTQRYTQMLAFLRAADEGSFSAAARAQGVAPSTISKLIGRLEVRLGARLFDRLGTAVALTREGIAYQRSAQAAAIAMEKVEEVGAELVGRAEGVLRIQTMPSFAKHQIVPWLPAFMQSYPRLRLEFELEPHFVDRFDQGVGVAIHSGALPDSRRVAQQIATSRWIVCAAPGYLARHGTPHDALALSRHRCLDFAFPSDWNRWTSTPNASGSIASTHGGMLRDLAIAEMGIARLAAFHVNGDFRSGALVEIPGPWSADPPEPIYLVHAGGRHLPLRVRVFRQAVTAQLCEVDWFSPSA